MGGICLVPGGGKNRKKGREGGYVGGGEKKGKEKKNNNNNIIIIKFKSRNQNYVPNIIFFLNCDFSSETKTTYQTEFFLQS
jgi:hypothetical protein